MAGGAPGRQPLNSPNSSCAARSSFCLAASGAAAELTRRQIQIDARDLLQRLSSTTWAYGRDPELYQFLKTMETYRKTFASDTTLILSTDGEFFRYLKQSR